MQVSWLVVISQAVTMGSPSPKAAPSPLAQALATPVHIRMAEPVEEPLCVVPATDADVTMTVGNATDGTYTIEVEPGDGYVVTTTLKGHGLAKTRIEVDGRLKFRGRVPRGERMVYRLAQDVSRGSGAALKANTVVDPIALDDGQVDVRVAPAGGASFKASVDCDDLTFDVEHDDTVAQRIEREEAPSEWEDAEVVDLPAGAEIDTSVDGWPWAYPGEGEMWGEPAPLRAQVRESDVDGWLEVLSLDGIEAAAGSPGIIGYVRDDDTQPDPEGEEDGQVGGPLGGPGIGGL
jgi:hypothetical protein